jgi:hypothetical protein
MWIGQRFLSSLFSSSNKKGRSQWSIPLDIDVAEIARKPNLGEKESQWLGEAGHSTTDSILSSGVESQFIQRIDRVRLRHFDSAANRLAVLYADKPRLDVTLATPDSFRGREANVRDASGWFLRCALPLFLVVVEAVMNGWFFTQGLEGGLVIGFACAALLSIVNVLIAAALGVYIVRNELVLVVGRPCDPPGCAASANP